MAITDIIQPQRTVTPRDFGLDKASILNKLSEDLPLVGELFGVAVYYKCGWCAHVQETRLPAEDHPTVKCDYCHTPNQFPLVRNEED
ncbi:hypothetical protein HZC30_04290 [Candidatus Woesearchaeota archaeon]|nr:hypothetical protein [Candidatus Woesearchaeota archaeon]